MPRHSHSSHSSHSHHSSSHHSSHHSHSSHSSRSYGTGGFGSRSHSASRDNFTGPSYLRGLTRTRRNQPLSYGRGMTTFISPVSYHCHHHDYVYYPTSWYDENNTHWKAGYYDEEGNYYSNVAFKQNNCYTTKLKCGYCGNEAMVNWTEGSLPVCNNCGARMEVINSMNIAYDEIAPAPAYGGYGSANSMNGVIKYVIVFIAITFLFGFLGIAGMLFRACSYAGSSNRSSYSFDDSGYDSSYDSGYVSNTEIFGTTLYLQKGSDGIYDIVDKDDDYDKALKWDYGEESYYDKESQCYIWFNTDVSPNLWQYYYMGISDSYPDGYGWMECEGDEWYIEKRSGWELLDISKNLWHIRNDFD